MKVKKEFNVFLKETTRFLYEIQELQMQWRWGGRSAIKGGLEWLQGLWASRRGVGFEFLCGFRFCAGLFGKRALEGWEGGSLSGGSDV